MRHFRQSETSEVTEDFGSLRIEFYSPSTVIATQNGAAGESFVLV